MPDLSPLRDLTTQLPAPDLEVLATVARRRRRRAAALGLGGLAVAAALVAAVAVPGAERTSEEPVDVPTPTEPDRPVEVSDWTPELIRVHAETSVDLGWLDDVGTTAHLYTVCIGRDCGSTVISSNDDAVHLGALEVTDAATGATRLVDYNPPWHPGHQPVHDLGDHLLVVDAPVPDAIEEWRYRLVDPTSSVDVAVDLDAVPARPGPDVLLLPEVGGKEGGLVLLDEAATTIRPLDVPPEVRMWNADLDRALWGVADGASRGAADQCTVWWQGADGGFDHHDLDCAVPSLAIPDLEANGLPPWEPGQMAAFELGSEGTARVVHVTTDGGRTWRRLPVQARGTAAQAEALDLLADVL